MIKKLTFEFVLGIIILILSISFFFIILKKIEISDNEYSFILNSSFFDIGSLQIGGDVKINGVKVGEVSNISLDYETYLAIVETSYINKINIPTDSIFKISNNGFVGSPYLEITLGSENKFYDNKNETFNNIDAISLEEIINNFIFK